MEIKFPKKKVVSVTWILNIEGSAVPLKSFELDKEIYNEDWRANIKARTQLNIKAGHIVASKMGNKL